MNKLSAYIMAFYMTSALPAFAAGGVTSHDVEGHAEDVHDSAVNAAHGSEPIHMAEGAEHASKGGLPQFESTWFASEIFWIAVSFAVLYVIFAKKTLPEISGVIENRKNHIQSDLETAEKLTAEADSVYDAYQVSLEKAQGKAAQAVLDVESDMKSKSAEAFDEFRTRSETEVKASESRITAAKSAAMDDMNDIAAEAASIAVEKIIGKSADANQVRAIIDGMNGKARAA